MNWKIINQSIDGEQITYLRESQDGACKEYMTIDLENKTVDFNWLEFILKESETWTAQQAEKNETVKWSCAYGHWQAQTIMTVSKDDLKFALSHFGEE